MGFKFTFNYTVKTSRGYMQGGVGSRENFQQVLNSFHTLGFLGFKFTFLTFFNLFPVLINYFM